MSAPKFTKGDLIRHKDNLFPVAKVNGVIGMIGGGVYEVEWFGPGSFEVEQTRMCVWVADAEWIKTTKAMEVLYGTRR